MSRRRAPQTPRPSPARSRAEDIAACFGRQGPFWYTRSQRRQYQRWYARNHGPKHGFLLLLCFVLLCGWAISMLLGTFHWSVGNVLIVLLTLWVFSWAGRPRHRLERPPR